MWNNNKVGCCNILLIMDEMPVFIDIKKFI